MFTSIWREGVAAVIVIVIVIGTNFFWNRKKTELSFDDYIFDDGEKKTDT